MGASRGYGFSMHIVVLIDSTVAASLPLSAQDIQVARLSCQMNQPLRLGAIVLNRKTIDFYRKDEITRRRNVY